jgi:hypothetical protein
MIYMDTLQDLLVDKYNGIVIDIVSMLKINMDSFSELSNKEKSNALLRFYDSFEDQDIFTLFTNSKIKVFSSKTEETHNVSTSLFGEEMSLKRFFNNQTDLIKSKLWKSLFKLYTDIESSRVLIVNQESRQDRLDSLNNSMSNSIKNLSDKVKSGILNVDVNSTTNNMIDDIVGSFQNILDKKANPFENIMDITNMITEKYQGDIQNGKVEIDKLLGGMQNSLPGMDKLFNTTEKSNEKVVMDENFSTADVDVTKEEETGGFNISNLMNMTKNLPNMSGLSSMVSKIGNIENEDDINNLKSQMDVYLKDELGVDMENFNKNMEDLQSKLEDAKSKDNIIED